MKTKKIHRMMGTAAVLASLLCFNACTEDSLKTDEETQKEYTGQDDTIGGSSSHAPSFSKEKAEAITYSFMIKEDRDGRIHYWTGSEVSKTGLSSTDTLYNVNTREITRTIASDELVVTKYNEVTVSLSSEDADFEAALEYASVSVDGNGIEVDKAGEATWRLSYLCDGENTLSIGFGENTVSLKVTSRSVVPLEGIIVKVDTTEIFVKAEESDNATYTQYHMSDWDYEWPGYYGVTVSPDIAGIGSSEMEGYWPNSEIMRNGKTIEIVSVVPQNASFTRCEFALVNNALPFGTEGGYVTSYYDETSGSNVEYTRGYMGNETYCPEWNWAKPETYTYDDCFGALPTEVNSQDMKAQYGADEVNIEDFLSWKTWNFKSFEDRKEIKGDKNYPITVYTQIYFIVKAEKGYSHLSWYAFNYNDGNQESYVWWKTWRRSESDK